MTVIGCKNPLSLLTRYVLISAVLAVAAVTYIAQNDAVAQQHPTAVVAVFSNERLMRESKAGQDIIAQSEALAQELQADFEARQRQFDADLEQYEKEIILIEDEAEAQQRQQALQEQYAEHNRRLNERRRKIAIATREAEGELMRTLNPIFQEVMQRHGATILLERGQVLIANSQLDITDEVITELDNRITSIKLELPED